ncbi:MAG: hypothetical protein ABJN35_00055 [Erythrobacter sp.]
MACLNCNDPRTIKAHLIPKAFVQEVKSSPGEQMMLVHEKTKAEVSNTGRYDPHLLCGGCDSHLGSHEGYVLELIRKLRKIPVQLNSFMPIDQVKGDLVVRFAAGIVWKFANTREEWGRIDIGPYVNILRDAALRNRPLPQSLDVVMIRLFEPGAGAYFYRNPLPDRLDQMNAVRFSVGGFLFFLKIDRRLNQSALPAECWLKGRSSGKLMVAPLRRFEEGKLYLQLRGSQPARGFFDNMKARQRDS